MTCPGFENLDIGTVGGFVCRMRRRLDMDVEEGNDEAAVLTVDLLKRESLDRP